MLNPAELDTILQKMYEDQEGYVLPEQYRSDPEAILTLMNRSDSALPFQYASKELKADREVVRAAVKNCSYALDFAAKELREDSAFMRSIRGL